MGEMIINNCMIGNNQNGSFVPIGKIDSIKEFEGATEFPTDDSFNTSIKFGNNLSYECTCFMSKSARKKLEKLFIYGWNNKMPLRKRLLRKARYRLFRHQIFNTLNFQINYEGGEQNNVH